MKIQLNISRKVKHHNYVSMHVCVAVEVVKICTYIISVLANCIS